MKERKLELEAARAGLLRVFPADHLFTIDDVATIISLAVSYPPMDKELPATSSPQAPQP